MNTDNKIDEKKEVDEIREIYKCIKIESQRKKIDCSLFDLLFSTLMRTPFMTLPEFKEILNTIYDLVKRGFDYTKLIRAGILAGGMPDYYYINKKSFLQGKMAGALKIISEDLKVFDKILNDFEKDEQNERYNYFPYFSHEIYKRAPCKKGMLKNCRPYCCLCKDLNIAIDNHRLLDKDAKLEINVSFVRINSLIGLMYDLYNYYKPIDSYSERIKKENPNLLDSIQQSYIAYWNSLSLKEKKLLECISPDIVLQISDNNIGGLAEGIFCEICNAEEECRKIVEEEIHKVIKYDKEFWKTYFFETGESKPMYFSFRLELSKKNMPPEMEFHSIKNPSKYDTIRMRPFDLSLPELLHEGSVELTHFDDLNDCEYYTFTNIYHKLLAKDGLDWIETLRSMLTKFFIKKYNKEPDITQFETLRKRYYRFINKAYSLKLQYDEIKGKWIGNPLDIQYGDRHYFYLKSPNIKNIQVLNMIYDKKESSKTQKDKTDKKNYYFGEMYEKNGRYLLCSGSLLSSKTKENTLKTFDERYMNDKEPKIVEMPNHLLRVIEDIEVKSPSHAAWLVCGYKRNGNTAWKHYPLDECKLDTLTFDQVVNNVNKNKKRKIKRRVKKKLSSSTRIVNTMETDI